MRLYYCNHLGGVEQAFLRPKRTVNLAVSHFEAPGGREKQHESKEGEPKVIPGVPIDVNPSENPADKEKEAAKKKAEEVRKKAEEEAKKKAEAEKLKKEAEIEAKKQLTEAEKKITDKYGGAVYEMSQAPGAKEKGYKSSVYINKPANPEKFIDDKGKAIPPKIVYFFRGKDDGMSQDAEQIIRRVEERRAKGENVILVMPQGDTVSAKDFDSKDGFMDLQRLAEQVYGAKNINDVSIAYSKEGNAAANKILGRMKELAKSDPEARAIYDKVSAQISKLQSAEHIPHGTKTPATEEEVPPQRPIEGAKSVVNTPTRTPQTAPHATQKREQVEIQSVGRTFVIGDSLAEGFMPKLKGFNVSLVRPEGKDSSVGQSTAEMLRTLRLKLADQDVAGSTLLILGGTNDIFASDSLEKIQANLAEIYKLAKEKGMKVIGATLPPLANSRYAKNHAKQIGVPYEKYNSELIARWNQLNEWIRGQKGEGGPDEIIEFATQLEDANNPGSLKAEISGEGGIHLKDYEPMAALIREHLPAPEKAIKAPQAARKIPEGGSQAEQNNKIRGNVPKGYGALFGSVPGEVTAKAKEVLQQEELGSVTPFEANGQKYVAVKEWHYNEQKGWHQGVTVLEEKAKEGGEPPETAIA
jgi:hypothetical protein